VPSRASLCFLIVPPPVSGRYPQVAEATTAGRTVQDKDAFEGMLIASESVRHYSTTGLNASPSGFSVTRFLREARIEKLRTVAARSEAPACIAVPLYVNECTVNCMMRVRNLCLCVRACVRMFVGARERATVYSRTIASRIGTC
jgi:hypothetical protein